MRNQKRRLQKLKKVVGENQKQNKYSYNEYLKYCKCPTLKEVKGWGISQRMTFEQWQKEQQKKEEKPYLRLKLKDILRKDDENG